MSNEQLAEAVRLLRRVMDAHTGDSRWRQDEWDVLDDDIDSFLRFFDAAPAEDDAAALVEALAGTAQLLHEAIGHPSKSAADCPFYVCPSLAQTLARARKAPVQG